MSNILTIARDQAGDLLRRWYLLAMVILGIGTVGAYILMMYGFKVSGDMAGRNPGMSGMGAAQMQAAMSLSIAIFQGLLHKVVALMGTVFALLLMSCSVRSEISKGTVRMILSRPVKRWEFILGKWLGCVIIVLMYSGIMGALVGIYTYRAYDGLSTAAIMSLTAGFLKAIMVGSAGMFLSMVMHPVGAAVIGFYCAGETFLSISAFWLKGLWAEVLKVPFYILPSYKALDLSDALINGSTPSAAEFAWSAAYALLFCGLMLYVTALLFRRRDLA